MNFLQDLKIGTRLAIGFAALSQVDAAGRTMSDIVAQVKRVNELIGEISHATQEQKQGNGQVSGAVSQLDQVTQQNAALVEQSAA